MWVIWDKYLNYPIKTEKILVNTLKITVSIQTFKKIGRIIWRQSPWSTGDIIDDYCENILDDMFSSEASWKLVRIFFLMIYRIFWNFSYVKSKSRSLGQIKGKPCGHTGGHIFKPDISKINFSVCLEICLAFSYIGHLRSKMGHQVKSEKNILDALFSSNH